MAKVRRVPVAELQPGDLLARDVLSEDGRVLLSTGVRLNRNYIWQLRQHGVEAVYVPDTSPPKPAPELSLRLRREVTQELRQFTDGLRRTMEQATATVRLPELELDTSGIRRAVVGVVREVLTHPAAALPLQELRQADEYTLLHSVEVCLLSTMIGRAMGLQGSALVDLAMGALLHDLGKVGIPTAILNKPDRLTPEELEVMKRHTTLGWVLLREQPDLPPEVALVALQHHERWDGRGYPMGLAGEQIHLYARICTVADVYDALTADRVYREGIHPTEALATMAGPMREMFDPKVLQMFMNAVEHVQRQGTA